MVDERTQFGPDDAPVPQSPSPGNGRSSKSKVDLFPALAERRTSPMTSIRQAPAPVRMGTQISIFNPISFDEALDIVECLRARAATTISLDSMKKADASRLVDFVAGASAALDGDFHKLSEYVYLFCPSNIKITAPNKQMQKTSGPQTGAFSLDFLYPGSTDQSQARTLNSWSPM
jgi:FtsZ-interacting cell division protein YlmF